MRSFEDTLTFLCYRTLASALPPFRQIFTEYGITEQQWRILRILWDSDGLSQNEISRKAILPKQSLVGIIDRMESMGLVQRNTSDIDRRKSSICLTTKALQMKEEITPKVKSAYRDLDKTLTPQEWTTLRKLLTKIIERDST